MALSALLRPMVRVVAESACPRPSCRRMPRVGIVIAMLCLPPTPATGDPPPRVRSTDAAMITLLREGERRSKTFGDLLEAIARSNGIVYVEFGVCAFGHLDGCLLPFIESTHGDRYLRVIVTGDKTRRGHDRLLALIAHELQHAIEVLEHPEVVDQASMDSMYRRLGIPLTGRQGYETSGAHRVEDAVLRELSRS